ncbi:MAG: hypothetical protein ABIY70_10560 [Capsulimonas sp.]|uniref:hypothetical protein n=1 Tax=Capsulimonas sp. TaxID=2494211 RepID=UPI003262D3F9
MTQSNIPNFPPPTNTSDFELALRRGLGRAVLWLQSGAVTEDRELILTACRENWAFDVQTEDNRALYMADVVLATFEPEFYTRGVIESLFANRDEHSFGQMYDLVGRFAATGSAEARGALYSAFERLAPSRDYYFANVLMQVDGLDGYLYAVQNWLGKPVKEDKDRDELDPVFLLNDAEERFGAAEVDAFLMVAAQNNPAIIPYHIAVREKRAVWRARNESRPARPAPTYNELRAMLAHRQFRLPQFLAHRGLRMDDETANRLAADLLTETNPAVLVPLLALFGEYKFPLSPDRLFELAQDSNPAVASAAAFALAPVEDARVRALGLSIMSGDDAPWMGARLLVYNFQPGDCEPMLRLLERLDDPDSVHFFGYRIRDVFEQNTTPEFRPILILLYEKIMSTLGRNRAVKCLAKLGPLPEYVLHEAPYDASSSTREFVAELLSHS